MDKLKIENKMNVNLGRNIDIEPFQIDSTISFLDELMQTRQELFDKQLDDNLKTHRKLSNLLLK